MKIVRHIPNSITSMNLLFGVMGVIYTFKGNFETAFLLMLAAAVCDFCDGLSEGGLKSVRNLGVKSFSEIQTKILVFCFKKLSVREKNDFFTLSLFFAP